MEQQEKKLTDMNNTQPPVQATPTQGASLAAVMKSPAVRARFKDILKEKGEGFIASVLAVVNNNALLSKATPMSVISAAMTAATLDLPLTTGLGYAAIVPFYNGKEGRTDAQFQLMTRGLVQLALRSGQYAAIEVNEVYEGEIVAFNRFNGSYSFGERTSDNIIGYMGYFRLLNGFEKYYYMSVEEIQAHAQRYSQTAKKGYGLWVEQFDAMARKTVLKLLLSRWGILSVELQKATTFDGSVGTSEDNTPIFAEEDGAQPPQPSEEQVETVDDIAQSMKKSVKK